MTEVTTTINDKHSVPHVDQPEDHGVMQQVSRDAYAKSSIKSDSGNACVRDPEGYIVCGPIVGYEHPPTGTSDPAFKEPEFYYSPLKHPEFKLKIPNEFPEYKESPEYRPHQFRIVPKEEFADPITIPKLEQLPPDFPKSTTKPYWLQPDEFRAHREHEIIDQKK